jgi:hypothetical protein
MKDKRCAADHVAAIKVLDKVRQLATILEINVTFQLCIPNAPDPFVAPGNPTFTPLGDAKVEV